MGSTTTEVNNYVRNDGANTVIGDTIDTGEDTSEKVAEIRSNIEATRAEMSETVDALQEKLNPEHIKEQVVDSVREATIGRAENMVSSASETVRGTGNSIVDRITDNPIPAAMIGIGLGWMLLNNSNRAAVARYQAQARARDISRDVSDNVQFKAMQVQEKAGELAEHAQDQAAHVASQSHQLMESSPLIAGALAVALGAAAGFIIPETSRENELLGPTRDRLLSQAKEMAGETMGKVQQVASEATHAATEAARQAAQDEAQSQGLTQVQSTPA